MKWQTTIQQRGPNGNVHDPVRPANITTPLFHERLEWHPFSTPEEYWHHEYDIHACRPLQEND